MGDLVVHLGCSYFSSLNSLISQVREEDDLSVLYLFLGYFQNQKAGKSTSFRGYLKSATIIVAAFGNKKIFKNKLNILLLLFQKGIQASKSIYCNF
jgi:hypothetical protein